MADNLTEAQGNIEAQRRATLEALAQGGQGAAAAVTLGQQQAGASQARALDQLSSGAALRGAPAGAQAAQQAIVAPVGERVGQYLASSGERYAQDMSRMTAANDNYMAQAGAAVPVIRAQADREVGLMREKWEDQAAEEARYGGYQTAGEYENAVTARAMERQQEALAALSAQSLEALRPVQQEQRRNLGAARLLEADARSGMGPATDPGTSPRTYPELVARQAATPEGVNRAGAEAYRGNLDRNRAQQRTIADTTRQGRREIDDPLNFFEFQRQAAIDDFGADPYDAFGRFAEPAPGDRLDAAQQQRDLDAYEQSGGQFLSYDEAVRASQPDERAFPRSVQRIDEAAERLGVAPETFEDIATHPSYGAAIAAIESLIADEELEGALPWSVVEQTLNAVYEQYGHDFPIQRQLLREMYASEFR